MNNNLTRDSQEGLAGRRRSIVEVIFDQKESGNRWAGGRNMRVKHGSQLGCINENRRYPPRGIPNHMLPHGLGGVGVNGNALRNRMVEGACRKTNNQRKHHQTNKRPAPRKRRARHEVCFSRFLHCPTTNSAIIPPKQSKARLQKPPMPISKRYCAYEKVVSRALPRLSPMDPPCEKADCEKPRPAHKPAGGERYLRTVLSRARSSTPSCSESVASSPRRWVARGSHRDSS
jgi:hypothetical protein